MAHVTRTLNPLPFQDLEPHRFEDLVRQLAYDFRTWRSLEATGRSGSDEGIDIRGLERVGAVEREEQQDEEEPTQSTSAESEQDRLWVVQCKREKVIGPAKVRTILGDFFKGGNEKPYGYILAAACDFSKKTRDAAADILRKNAVREFYLWGKGEIEDVLIQPKNDHLLFAYFGISLQIRRRSMQTDLRSKLALKRKLVKAVGELREIGHKAVLIRDPRDEDYPYIKSKDEFVANPRWRYWEFRAHEPPDHLAFVTRKFFAYVNWQTEEWDFIREANEAMPTYPHLYCLEPGDWDAYGKCQIARAYWELHVPEERRAWAIEVGTIEYERILLCDELGDRYHEGPHLLVEFVDGWPFNRLERWIESADGYSKRLPSPDESKRLSFFPKPIPDEREQWHEDMRKRAEDGMREKP